MNAAASIPHSARKLRVLIVEDEPRLRDLMSGVIARMHFPVQAVRSAEDAQRLMEADPHEIMLLDLNLPLMGGMEFFQIVHQRWPGTKVIILSGYGDLAAAQQAIRLEVVDFLAKPCHLRDLELALERARQALTAPAAAHLTPPRELMALMAQDESQQATLADTERQQILATLARNGGNRTTTATELGISRRTLHYRLSEYKRQGILID